MLELLDLSKRYGEVVSLDRVNLVVPPGEVYGYVGPNGAGKSTTARILSGLIRPTSGEAKIGGHSVVSDVLAARQKLGYLPESGAIFEKLTPREYLGSVGELYRLDAKAIGPRIEELLALFVLSPRIDERMDTFSKGMKQKIAWCAALLHQPEVLLLDEPLNGLDAEAVRVVKDLLRRYAAEGRTVFYTSHLLDIVEKVCDRVGVLYRGRLIAEGRPAELCGEGENLEAALVRRWRQEGP